ncbi:hypothetical protein ACEWPL_008700 [Roseovarius sp. S1116L3]|uniref:hypothetical protein n=1 Tax=Roseovarius roseus TaxID=3342636 RepID=UPI00372750AD
MLRAASYPFRAAALLGLAALALTGCQRSSEDDMRAVLDGWAPLGETLSFTSQRHCAAGRFELVDGRIASRMRVAGDAREAAMILRGQGAVAIDDARLTPDAAIAALIEADRGAGMAMRMAGLEGRACMDAETEAAFATALVAPRAVLMVGRDQGILALMDVDAGVVVATMGAK